MKGMLGIVVAVTALAVLAGCPKKQEVELQGAPAASQPPATHTMPGGEQMPGMKHPTTPGEQPSAKWRVARCWVRPCPRKT